MFVFKKHFSLDLPITQKGRSITHFVVYCGYEIMKNITTVMSKVERALKTLHRIFPFILRIYSEPYIAQYAIKSS